MHFKIIVLNGHFPLEHCCSTAYEAFGCIETLSTGLLHDIPIDMDDVMAQLIEMKKGQLVKACNRGYTIMRIDGEV